LLVVIVGHCEDEDTFPLVRRADFCRREQSCLNRKAKLVKVSVNALGASDFVIPRREHAADILNKDEPCARLDDDAACV
jgi:hypothetical protein